jgi:riboflavin transporter FmnP
MTAIWELVSSGRIAEIAAALLLVEVIALGTYYRRTGRGVPIGSLLANFAAGLMLLLAFRAASTDASPATIATFLALAFAAHAADIAARWEK